MEKVKTDFLIIGSGVAGLRAAIELAPFGKVIVVTKDIPTESSTEYAQGGVAVALSDEDEVGIHFEDTIKAGDGLCREDAVKVLVEEGPQRILELIEWGAEFDKEGTKLSFTLEAAHSRRRILHAQGDSTGRELERVLINKVKSLKKVQRFQFCTAIDLIIDDGRCCGAYVLKNADIIAIYSRATVLATGGAGRVFSRTTNPAVVTGDGMAIGYRAGAVLEDMEFVQFHPTVLFASSAPQFLLSEAMRGEGAILRNIYKEPFVKNYHPDAELAPRDVVSRAIISEMVKTKSNHVYLDLTHLDGDFIKKRFPRIYSTCLQYDVNIIKDLIPVTPAAHYIMGGVKTDLNGSTNIKGLYAAGEVACTGVHGANRLASNSLLEGLVFGERAGKAAVNSLIHTESFTLDSKEITAYPSLHDHEEIRHALKIIMWEKVGIIRCEESLKDAQEKLAEWSSILHKTFSTRRGLELKNMLTVAILITEAALLRKGSVGAHYRSDCPERGEGWQGHILLKKGDKELAYGYVE
ncbi:MAG: L-aspartate oxidase [Nitrospirota bacterium]|nr:L-aspartate oxidase [Nitrospirota bacterium]MDH5769413.1 L-aspartate oxidase [Nitrospirota bacterium]